MPSALNILVGFCLTVPGTEGHAISTIKRLKLLASDPSDIRPCHCELNFRNVLFDNSRFYLIDWTTSSQDNFYFDLPSVINMFFYGSKEDELVFLEAYFRRALSESEVKKVNSMRQVAYVYYGIILLYMSELQKDPILSNDQIDALPDYVTFMKHIQIGKEDLNSARTQQKLGWISIKAAEKYNGIV